MEIILDCVPEARRKKEMIREDDDGNTPLQLAVEAGNNENLLAKVFPQNSGTCRLFNTANKQGDCLLHAAAKEPFDIFIPALKFFCVRKYFLIWFHCPRT